MDTDCPLKDDEIHSLVVGKMRDPHLPLSRKKGLRSFLSSFREKVNSGVDWDEGILSTVEKSSPKTEAGLKSAILDMLVKDSVFNSTLRRVAETDSDFRADVTLRKQGICSNNVCDPNRSPTYTPHYRVFDGKGDVSFSRKEDGNVYAHNGGQPFRVNASKCTPELECDLYHEAEGRRLAATDPLRQAYWVHLSEGDSVLIMNELATPFGKEACPSTLCDAYSSSCPAPFCTRNGGGGCVATEMIPGGFPI